MLSSMMKLFLKALLVLHFFSLIMSDEDCSKTICNPRAGDLLIGRESFLRASSTCGMDEFESYCVVTPIDRRNKLKCSICYSKDPYHKLTSPNSHRIENVVSLLPQDPNRWWQSEVALHNVSIEVTFETEFQFVYSQLRFKTYRPAAMYIERSKDYGRTWQIYAYFSENCAHDFPKVPAKKRTDISEVTCTGEFSSFSPSEDGTVLFIATPSDLKSGDKIWNKKRNDITAVTNLRVQFVRLHTFGDWKIDDSPNIKNKYYYAVSEWIIRGRCSCYGHASKCKPKNGQLQTNEMVYGVCECQHNTKGPHCEKCKDFYNDSPWMAADESNTNECRRCNCNGHSTSCHFNPVVYHQSGNKSGGVCDNCQDNTESKNCERCKSGYYRNVNVKITSKETCLKCNCNPSGSLFPELCVQETDHDQNLIAGSCICKDNVDGFHCDRCKAGFWKFDANNPKGCVECSCTLMGTLSNRGCDLVSGFCPCKKNVIGGSCSVCKDGYYNMSTSNSDGCDPCQCSKQGSVNVSTCNKYNGQCQCKPGYKGRNCGDIKDGWYIKEEKYPLKPKEEIKIELPPVSKTGHYNVIITMSTEQMAIVDRFTLLLSVDHSNRTTCPPYTDTIFLTKDNTHIVVPNKCLVAHIPIHITIMSIEQPVNQFSIPEVVDIIVIPKLDENSGRTRNILAECLKKPKSNGKMCAFIEAEVSSKAFSKTDPQKCACNITGSTSNICSKTGGQCSCLPNVAGKECDRCSDYSYGFSARGCKKCNCDLKGSLSLQCNKDVGSCLCRKGIEGRRCDSCKSGFWNFPFCEPCQCNGMADSCDQSTGRCLNCQGHSFGFNCQQCNNGYYGDLARQIPCQKCHCPGTVHNLNHSIGCNLIFNTSTYICICKPGYAGKFCDICDINHYGNPKAPNGICKRCTCSNNIDYDVPGSCDSKTGECKKCLYKTVGFNCEKCIPGYFGNGARRSCEPCVCNELGTDAKAKGICNQETGKCPCLPHVVGLQCDRCDEKFYNLSSGVGCFPCDCDFPAGSEDHKCNQLTGQCNCRRGRSGRKCDHCQDGFWGDPRRENGCKKCMCNSDGSIYLQCDRNTGACRCKAGIIGRYCDQCSRGTDGNMPNCTSCGNCWIQWDRIIASFENSNKQMQNESGQFLKTVGLPREIIAVTENVNHVLREIKRIMGSSFPTEEFCKFVEEFATSISKQFNLFTLPDLKLAHPLEDTTRKLRRIEEQLRSDKIKMVEGALNEIRKIWDQVSGFVQVVEKNKMKLKAIQNNIFIQTKDFHRIDIPTLNKTTKHLSELSKLLSQNLINFYGTTCSGKMYTDPLNCSDYCNHFGCRPESCHRKSVRDPKCNDDKTIFFNAFAWKIDKRNTDKTLSDSEEEIAKINTTITMFLSKTCEMLYQEVFRVSELVNNTISQTFYTIMENMKRIKILSKDSISEQNFKSLLEKIGNFTFESKRYEIEKLEKVIALRRKKLLNVDEILDASRNTTLQCNALKEKASQEKQNTDFFMKSIDKLKKTADAVAVKQATSKLQFQEIIETSNTINETIPQIRNSYNKAEGNVIIITDVIERLNALNAEIKANLTNMDKMIEKIDGDNENMEKNLLRQKERMQDVLNQRNKLLEKDAQTNIQLSKIRTILFQDIDELKLKLNEELKKVQNLNASMKEKQDKVEKLKDNMRKKLITLQNLQTTIYSKADFQATCFP